LIIDYYIDFRVVVEDHSLKIRFHYNGYFTADPHVCYKRGETYEFEGTWDLNEVNLIDLEKLVREVGVKGDYTVWYPVAGGELKEGLRAIKTYGDVVRFKNDYKSEETVNFYLEHLSLEDLDNIYQDEEFFYSGEEPESETDPEYVPWGGEHFEHESVDGATLNDSDYDEKFDWTTVLPDQLINPTPVDASSGSV